MTIAPPACAASTPKNRPVTSPPGHSSVPISFSGTDHTRERHSATTPTTHPIPTKNAPRIRSTIVDHSLPSAGARLERSTMPARYPLHTMDDLTDLMTPWCVHTVATLGIARHLERGTDAIGPLADAAGCDERALHNVLGHLVTRGVFTEPAPGRFALTDAGGALLNAPFLNLDGIGGRFAGAWETIP